MTEWKHSCTYGFEKSESAKRKRRMSFLLIPLKWTFFPWCGCILPGTIVKQTTFLRWDMYSSYVSKECIQAQRNSMNSWRLLGSEFLTSDTFPAVISNSKLFYCCIWEDHRTSTLVQLFLLKHPFSSCHLFSYTTSHVAVPCHSLSFLLLRDLRLHHCKNSWCGRLTSLAAEMKQLWLLEIWKEYPNNSSHCSSPALFLVLLLFQNTISCLRRGGCCCYTVAVLMKMYWWTMGERKGNFSRYLSYSWSHVLTFS